jgi:ABC-type branched-subunit amino acid transport system substrate-binding protein
MEEDINRRGGLLGRPVRMICLDDATDPKRVPDIYKTLFDEEKVTWSLAATVTIRLHPPCRYLSSASDILSP